MPQKPYLKSDEYVDAHSHLADPRLALDLAEILNQAAQRGIAFHLQGGVGPEDWDRQIALHRQYPQILPVFGLHPYWVADHSEEECESALDRLAKILGAGYALGEVGLDFRPKIMKDSRDLQIRMVEAQLDLAALAGKACVFHLVQAFSEALRIFEVHGAPRWGGMIHSFNGSEHEAEAYLDLGFYLSVGGPVTRADNHRLRQAVLKMPLDRILIETDAPDQVVSSRRGQLGRSGDLFEIAKAVADIKSLTADEVLDNSRVNLKKLLNL